jgi:hypothetical protein
MAALETMVKRTLYALAAVLAAAAGWGLGAREAAVLSPSVMGFRGIRPAPFTTLLRRGPILTVVVADRDTMSLRVIEVPVSEPLPAEAPAPVFVDKVDIVPPLGGSFGLHAAAEVDGRLRLLYLDREKEDRQLLKRVTEDTGAWRLELVEPIGPPVAVLAGPDGEAVDAWAPGGLLLRGAAGDQAVLERFVPRGQSVLLDPEREPGPSGFGCWDDATGQLFVVSAGPHGVRCSAVQGANQVFAPAEAPDGGLAIATWDPVSRRILLLERAAGEAGFRQTTVTVCDGTSSLFLAWSPSGWVFVYDEVKPAPLGRWVWELGVLSPEPRTVGRPRYRRSVVSSGSEPIAGFRATIAEGSLFVLEQRGLLRLLKTPLP